MRRAIHKPVGDNLCNGQKVAGQQARQPANTFQLYAAVCSRNEQRAAGRIGPRVNIRRIDLTAYDAPK
jgi:hypothetical protein